MSSITRSPKRLEAAVSTQQSALSTQTESSTKFPRRFQGYLGRFKPGTVKNLCSRGINGVVLTLMAPTQDEMDAMRVQVGSLTTVIFRLEQRLGIGGEAPQPEVAAPMVQPSVAASGPPPTSGPQTAVPPSPSYTAARSTPKTGNLESKIGKLWFSWIGIIAILGAVSYFLKLAFDSGRIAPRCRGAMGVGAGALGVLCGGHVRRPEHASVSDSLK